MKALLLKHGLPLLILGLFVLFLATLNYKPGTLLLGGDNLLPEFNFPLNIGRSIFSVWQEYQGLGLLAGMGHASDLLRQLFLWGMSLFLPTHTLRFFWTMLTLFLGSLGVFYLLRMLLSDAQQKQSAISTTLLSLVGAVFSILNLGTIQTYYTPFEVFDAHFAALPWLLFVLIRFLRQPSKRNLAWWAFVLLLTTPEAYVPTLFVVSLLAIGVVFLFSAGIPTSPAAVKTFGKKLTAVFVPMFLVNAFWLLPFAYFTFTSANVNVNAKINQMATETIFEKNKAFGHLTDVSLLKGFWLNNVEPNLQQQYAYMLQPWREHLSHTSVIVVGYILFAIILLGFLRLLKKRTRYHLAFASLFIISIIMLTTATPPFSFINTFLRNYVPLLGQILRFPFTKFALLAAISYAILFVYGLEGILIFVQRNIIDRMRRYISNGYNNTSSPFLTFLASIVALSLLISFTFPVFQGHLFYDKEQLQFPAEYRQLFSYFEKQDPNTRIADFPQFTFWAWNFYQWGYGGSGFLWYGIKQPILDRSFDVWSQKDETYYFELANALYAKNGKAFDAVLQKYQVNWLLLDENMINLSSPQALFVPEFKSLVSSLPDIKKTAQFGSLSVYHVALKDQPKSYVFTTPVLPTANSVSESNDDSVYRSIGTYASPAKDTPDYFYPIRSLFTLKTQKEIPFHVKENGNYLTFTIPLPTLKNARLTIPSFAEKERVLPVDIFSRRGQTSPTLIIQPEVPVISLHGKTLTGRLDPQSVLSYTLAAANTDTQKLIFTLNGVTQYTIPNKDSFIGTTFISLTSTNSAVIKNDNDTVLGQITIDPTHFLVSPMLKSQTVQLSSQDGDMLTIRVPKIQDNYLSYSPSMQSASPVTNCDLFNHAAVSSSLSPHMLTFSATMATACTSFYNPNLPHDTGYIMFVTSKNDAGRSLDFWLENVTEHYSPFETYLPQSPSSITSVAVIPPMDPYGQGYAFHFSNMSVNQDRSTNSLNRLSVYPLPYSFLMSLRISQSSPKNNQEAKKPDRIMHPQETLYTITLPAHPAQELILSQAFDTGWQAYLVKNDSWISRYFPFLVGKRLTQHRIINNWENGWHIPQSTHRQTLIIIFWPQYLEFGGFILLVLLGIAFLLFKRRTRRFDKEPNTVVR